MGRIAHAICAERVFRTTAAEVVEEDDEEEEADDGILSDEGGEDVSDWGDNVVDGFQWAPGSSSLVGTACVAGLFVYAGLGGR